MNTLLLDSCTNVVQMMEKMMHNVCEANATNCNDVRIAENICGYILWIAIVAAATFLAWKILDHISNGVSVWYKRQCDVEDNERKMNISVQEHTDENENRQYKKDLLNKKLEMLKEMSSGDDSNKINKEAAEKYIAAIDEALKK